MANNNNSRPPSNQPGNGGNWPSTTGEKSGGGRGEAAPKSGKR
tara:strand:+ start:57 stop:185 length:129 start_codon:yes stop_codon:yes gene_type:complete